MYSDHISIQEDFHSTLSSEFDIEILNGSGSKQGLKKKAVAMAKPCELNHRHFSVSESGS